MSRVRRALTIVTGAAALGGATLTACSSDSITGAPPAGPSASDGLVSPAILGPSESEYTYHPAEHRRRPKEEVEAEPDYVTAQETTFPVTEAVYNTCRNEGPIVLNGYLRSRMRVDADPMGPFHFQLREWKDTRGVYGDYAHDHDGNPFTEPHLVRYHNREFLIDQFKVGPAEAPFRSEFISKMHLMRQGHDHRDDELPTGDDLFVTVKQIMKVGTDGAPVVKHEFSAECR